MLHERSREEDITFSGGISRTTSRRRCHVKEGIGEEIPEFIQETE